MLLWRAGLYAAGDEALHEIISELVEAGLTAEVFGSCTHPGTRIPAANAQFARLFRGDEPVIGLPLFCSANVTRDCLPDHRFSFAHALGSACLYCFIE